MRDDQVKISVIMPVYNAQEYLEDSIVSLLEQDYRDFELLIVDDGSTDRSPEICKKYAGDDDRIKCFGNTGRGVVSARNTAVRNATGDYVCFCDADDVVESNFLSAFVKEINRSEPDIVISGFAKEQGGVCTRVCNKVPSELYEGDSLKNMLGRVIHWSGLFEFGVNPYLVTKCIRRELAGKVMEDTDETIKEGEDAAIAFPCIFMSRKIVVTEDCLYHYRMHDASVTHTRNFDYFENVAALYKDINRKLKKTDFYDLACPQLKWYMRMLVYIENPNAFEMRTHIFPFGRVEKGMRIAIYGAGNVGRLYKFQIEQQNYGTVVCWVDKGWEKYKDENWGIVAPDELKHVDFEYVVIAIDDKTIVSRVRNFLIELGIPDNKIVD